MKLFARFKRKKECTLCLISFLQALGLILYCNLVGLLVWKGDTLFGPPFGFWGPAFFFAVFSFSALVAGLLVLGYPSFLFWVKKKRKTAIRLVLYTTGWLVGLLLLFLLILVIS